MKKMTGLSERAKHWWMLCNGLWMAVSVVGFLPAQVQAGRNEGVLGRLAAEGKDVRPTQSTDAEGIQQKFSLCVSQAQQAASQKAISCFQQLVQAYPELPEPYNNIGVLYAGMGLQVEARKWFERGLKQRQAYATLHQNLLNLQGEINRNAYAAALQLDISKSNAQPKLGLLAKITSMPEVPSPVGSLAAASSPSKPTPPVGTSLEPAAVKEEKVSEKPAVVAPAAPAAPSVTAVDLAQQSQVRETVQAWAVAWSKKDLDAYLKAYAPSFNPGSNLSRGAWEEQRRDRIMSKKQIHIALSEFNISFSNSNSKATAKFLQSYQSGSIVTVSRKTLELALDKGQWFITREFVSGT